MQRSRGAHPVSMPLFALFIIIVYLGILSFCHHQATRLNQRVATIQAVIDAPQSNPSNEEESVEEMNRDLTRFSDDSAWLAGYQQAERSLWWCLLPLCLFLTLGIRWARDPVTA